LGSANAGQSFGRLPGFFQCSSSDYEVHYIGVNWPHHVFVNQDFKVIGAE
jgi:hypothetical protein